MVHKFKDYNGLILFFGSKRKYSDNKLNNNINNKLVNKIRNKVIEDSNGKIKIKIKILFFLLFVCGILLLFYVFFSEIFNIFTHFKNLLSNSNDLEIEKLKELELQKLKLKEIQEMQEKQELQKIQDLKVKKIGLYTLFGTIIIFSAGLIVFYYNPGLYDSIYKTSSAAIVSFFTLLTSTFKEQQSSVILDIIPIPSEKKIEILKLEIQQNTTPRRTPYQGPFFYNAFGSGDFLSQFYYKAFSLNHASLTLKQNINTLAKLASENDAYSKIIDELNIQLEKLREKEKKNENLSDFEKIMITNRINRFIQSEINKIVNGG